MAALHFTSSSNIRAGTTHLVAEEEEGAIGEEEGEEGGAEAGGRRPEGEVGIRDGEDEEVEEVDHRLD